MIRNDKGSPLQRYVRDHDEDAFREIVSNYIGLVEATALRRLNNDAARAAEITQIVFTDLARQAPRLSSGTLLGSWLYKHTCFVASKFIRSEQRRLAREKEASQMLANDSENDAWAEVAPLLDTAMLELSATDQNAIVLRFFEKRDLRSIGAIFSISEDAAQKRVQRALEKLRDALQSKGVSIGVPALTALLISKGVLPASAASISAVASTALTAASQSAAPLLATVTAIFMTKTAIVLTAIGLGGLVVFLLAHKGAPEQIEKALVAQSSSPKTQEPAQPQSPPLFQPLASRVASLSVDEMLKALEMQLTSSNEQKIKQALFDFCIQYDAASPEDKFQLRRAIPLITALWKNASVDLKSTIISTLERFKPSTEEIVDLYLDAFNTEELRNSAIAGIMFAGPVAAKATDLLVDQLKRNHGVNDTGFPADSNARMSLEALSNIGPAAAAAVPMLKEFLSDTNVFYRVIGAKAYWNITHDADTVLPVLTNALLKDGSFWAAEILGQMGDAAVPAVDALEKAYASDANPSAQLYAYEAIRQIDTTRGLSPDRLLDLMQNGNDISRLHAAKLLWNDYKNPEQVVPALKRLITEPADPGSSLSSSTETHGALDLLAEIGPRAQDTLPQIRSILENPIGSSFNWVAATNAWRSIAGDQPIPSKRPLP